MSDIKYISLGIQCTAVTALERMNLKAETLPFDWMISNPKFVYEMIRLLLENKLSSDELVRQEFFACNKKAACKDTEHYYESEKGSTPFNEKYSVVFPHEAIVVADDVVIALPHETIIAKYIRRFDRLRKFLLDGQLQLVFLYVGPVAQSGLGAITFNKKQIDNDVYLHLNKLDDLIFKVRGNKSHRIIVFDATHDEAAGAVLEVVKIQTYSKWHMALNEVIDNLKKML